MVKSALAERNNSVKTKGRSIGTEDGAVVAVRIENQKEFRDCVIRMVTEKNDAWLKDACKELDKTTKNIERLIDTNRGGDKGIHGFIAEQLEVGIGNANSIMEGAGSRYVLLDNNGRDDLLIDSNPIQMKFVQKALGLDAVKDHMIKYPGAIGDGEIYMIPHDFWDRIQFLSNVPAHTAGNLRNSDYVLWKKLQELREDGLPADRICAAEFDYKDAQRESYKGTIESCRNKVKQKRNSEIYTTRKANAPSINEALKNLMIGAEIEGVLSGIIVVYDKYKEGIDVLEYSKDDIIDVAKASGKGCVNGATRSVVIYLLVNCVSVPSGIASGAYTFTEKAIKTERQVRRDELSKEEAREELISAAIEVVVTTTCAALGARALPKNKVAGAIMGTGVAKGLLLTEKKVRRFLSEKPKCDEILKNYTKNKVQEEFCYD